MIRLEGRAAYVSKHMTDAYRTALMSSALLVERSILTTMGISIFGS